ncbi:sugar phosphate isomerase/epimerase family protein [Cecembia calidifontis]|jgi:sugar phosphate isomerase/epimerase|uniref:Sugar phosphate isomerase/epimerase n=1 Tax=Cecembia calidifontis TaxID=1187080 RepID=A0A4Q7PED3_9BACT|nr:sugar phosphate isomerase/epimerase [Cecembia calidifontis]RZS98771.1 sugar phosphate isomerase/epimerase [Cecembia calidifontis]
MNKRRKFIQMSAVLGAGAFLPLQFCNTKKEESTGTEAVIGATSGILDDFGIQLYSVKENMAEDPVATIRAMASFGYTQLEGFDGGKGIFWGMSHTEFKSLMDDLGVDFIASHANTFQNLDELAEKAGAIGMKYLICPWVGPQKSMDDYKRLADEFNKQGEICKQHGLRFAYHNHGYTFEELDGQIPQDYLMQNTDPDLVDYEMDTYWVYTAGKDPISYIKKYPNRFVLGHVKDKSGDLPFEEPNGSTLIGKGIMDFPSILRAGMDNGMKYYIVEQERFDGTDPMEAAKINAAYMKSLVF